MNILYLTFYFEPDMGPGAFRNTSLVYELARQLNATDSIHVITTQPNRYQSFKPNASAREERYVNGTRIIIERIAVPVHASGLFDQIRSFLTFFRQAHYLTHTQSYSLVVASSSRLFTAFLGTRLARRNVPNLRIPLFLDIRDIFREAILDVLKNPIIRLILNPILKFVERYTFGYAGHINLVSEGFRPYFERYNQATYSFYTNGIDDEFLQQLSPKHPNSDYPNPIHNHSPSVRTILYAGNIGEGQGLHKLIPEAARQLAAGYRFVIIGDGGAKTKLLNALRSANVANVDVRLPIRRTELVAEYQKADYLLAHLNDLEACKRVLPSKLFEYAATDKPILAGMTGYAATFITENIPNCILFEPGNVNALVNQLRAHTYQTENRYVFRAKFQRKSISRQMALQIYQTAHVRK